MDAQASRTPFMVASALAWAGGAAAGAALGSWLTAVGQVGAGTELEPVYDLMLLPGASFVVVFVVALGVLVASDSRRRRS